MRAHIRAVIHAMRLALDADELELCGELGLAAYRVSNEEEREVLETFLGPHAARLAGIDR
ncbi:hypothetical protein [Streptomyces lydicus]|uniref:hypothetical protein n=1 Tax=Streptomyces lydicus TaxID=47763 RepID=UPI0037888539